jgi:hypothetical protein
MYNPKEQRPNAIQALQEVEKRLRLNIKGDIATGRWEAIKIVLSVKKEITDGIFARMRATVESFTNDDDQPTDAEVDASDAADYLHFLKQCRP